MRKFISILLALALLLSCVVLPAAAASHPFTDVPEGIWYEEPVAYCYDNGLIKGTSDTTFGPDINMDRGMLVTVLHRMEGEPAPSGTFPFTDVDASAYYRTAVHWAYSAGVVNGTSDTTFAPTMNITREQMVTIFFRYAGNEGLDISARADLSGYSDQADISDFAADAFRWAVDAGIINGVSNTELSPKGLASRAQCATILQRFIAWSETQNTEPEPTETEPTPTETEPAPTETEPAPTETEPAPTETEPAPTETEPAPDASATALTAEKDAELHADLRKRIGEILSTGNEIVHSDTFIPGKTYTGTAYYFSNDGDDNNDGLTPETAWQSVGKLLSVLDGRDGNVLKSGDAVFLRRGDIFRLPDWALEVSVDGITLSAYGEGEKPILTASSENGSGSEKWKLVYEDATGKKIWQFYKDVRDVGMVVLEDGKAIAERVYEYYDGTKYISLDEQLGWHMHEGIGVTLLDRLLSLEESLTEDLTVISRAKSPNTPWGEAERGPLYLRCDKGNPGTLYSSIEFTELEPCAIIWLEASDVVFDNISMRCNGSAYMKSNIDNNQIHWSEYENTVIQNCEFAYGGGSVWDYGKFESSDTYFVGAQGDGIYSIIKNTTIRNNYFHDSMCSTTTYEWAIDDERVSGGYYHVLDNVMVNTNGIRLDSTSPALQYLDSVIIRGNQVWNTGHFDNGKIIYSEGSIVLWPNHYDECIIENNVFYATENGYENNALLNVHFYLEQGDTIPQIRNNIYAQYSGRKFGYFYMLPEFNLYIDDSDLKTKVAEIIGDTTSEFYIIE